MQFLRVMELLGCRAIIQAYLTQLAEILNAKLCYLFLLSTFVYTFHSHERSVPTRFLSSLRDSSHNLCTDQDAYYFFAN